MPDISECVNPSSDRERDALMERCRETLLQPTYWERHAGSDELERREASFLSGPAGAGAPRPKRSQSAPPAPTSVELR